MSCWWQWTFALVIKPPSLTLSSIIASHRHPCPASTRPSPSALGPCLAYPLRQESNPTDGSVQEGKQRITRLFCVGHTRPPCIGRRSEFRPVPLRIGGNRAWHGVESTRVKKTRQKTCIFIPSYSPPRLVSLPSLSLKSHPPLSIPTFTDQSLLAKLLVSCFGLGLGLLNVYFIRSPACFLRRRHDFVSVELPLLSCLSTSITLLPCLLLIHPNNINVFV